jgi:hypothetical protein
LRDGGLPPPLLWVSTNFSDQQQEFRSSPRLR